MYTAHLGMMTFRFMARPSARRFTTKRLWIESRSRCLFGLPSSSDDTLMMFRRINSEYSPLPSILIVEEDSGVAPPTNRGSSHSVGITIMFRHR